VSRALTATLIPLTLGLVSRHGPLQAQDQKFSASTETVRVDVLVKNGNDVVAGLTPRDFEILDNGVVQQVNLVSFEDIPLNVILVLDVSESVAGERLDQLQEASALLLSGLKMQDQSALVTFNHQVRLPAPLSPDVTAVRRALADVGGAGRTALTDAVYAGLTTGDTDSGRALVIVFSDGVDTGSWLSVSQVLDTAKRSDAVVYGVSVRSRVKPEFLSDLTSTTGGRLYEVERIQSLPGIFVDILEEFRHRYLIGYTPRGVATNGWHRLEVHVKRRGVTVHARPGYLAGQ
jgi:VWFA-related protein